MMENNPLFLWPICWRSPHEPGILPMDEAAVLTAKYFDG
jgi:hypothetical protein